MTDCWNHVSKSHGHLVHVTWAAIPSISSTENTSDGPVDFPVWVQFSKWYLHQCNTQPTFPHLVLFVDEACFTCEAMFIAETAMYGMKTIHIPLFSDDTISILQAGIVSDQFTGPYLPPIRLNVYKKQQLLQALPELLRTCHYGYVNRCVPVRWSNNTLHLFCLLLPGCYISPSLDWVGWNNFLASTVTWPDTTYFFGLTLKL
jgi:hypothetical protein